MPGPGRSGAFFSSAAQAGSNFAAPRPNSWAAAAAAAFDSCDPYLIFSNSFLDTVLP